ncbi:hypothetical protein SAMN05216215_108136 [Saccharopolyspora shandongensis]|uniref:Uncharacterized protein n=1 Tax=Saccharopolyspora shandongensis TaxID=418495 RepID=A0A1H3TEV8_9PSEU|nr:hypothetical protein SAMN05216215_108136 [Saccharopolyspora shandongensis]
MTNNAYTTACNPSMEGGGIRGESIVTEPVTP